MIIRLEGGEWVVYDEAGIEVARFDDPTAAIGAFPDAQPAPAGWEPGQPIPAVTTGAVPVTAAGDNIRWKEPTKTLPGQWEIHEVDPLTGEDRWRAMTPEEIVATGLPAPTAVGGPFAEPEPTGAAAGGGGGGGAAVSDADRALNLMMGLDLSDREIKDAKILGIPLDEYANILGIAKILDTQPAAIMARVRAGESLEALTNQAEYAQLGRVIEEAPLGETPQARTANFKAAVAEGLTLDEAAAAVAAGVPIEGLGVVKQQLAQIQATGQFAPEDIPTFAEAIEGQQVGLSPFETAQHSRYQREEAAAAVEAGFPGAALPATEKAGATARQEYRQAQALAQEAVFRGKVAPEEAGRYGRQELARIQKREAAEDPLALFDVLQQQGFSADEINRRLVARFGQEAITKELATTKEQRYVGHGYGVAGWPAGTLGERMWVQRMREAAVRRELEWGFRPGEEPRVPILGERGYSPVERWPEIAERERKKLAEAEPTKPKRPPTRIGAPEENEDIARLERGLSRRRAKRTLPPAGFQAKKA